MATSPRVKRISECLVKPLHDLPLDSKQPIHFTPFELHFLNVKYSQKGLLFAKPDQNQDFSITDFLHKLRHSLSATITHFYPLAARFATQKQEKPHSYVIYIDPENSPGVKFIYATTDATISDVVNSPYVPLLVHSFFDLNNAINHDGHTLPLLSIQVTELSDGIFIGGSVNHLVADGTSFWHFMYAWSEIFRSKDENSYVISRPPIFRRSTRIISLPYTHEDQFIEQSVTTGNLNSYKERFFHFSSASISRLKAKVNAECNTQIISSLQSVSALLWRCITRVRRLPRESETICQFVVSNRRRVNPPLSDDYFGNPVQLVRGTATVEDLMDHGLGWAALRLHEILKNHGDAAVQKWVDTWLTNPVVYKMTGLLPGNIVHIGSSPRFEMYGCEFGLGNAVAARSGLANKADGKMTMYPGREGGGSMDVEVCLFSDSMTGLECDEEFLSALKLE